MYFQPVGQCDFLDPFLHIVSMVNSESNPYLQEPMNQAPHMSLLIKTFLCHHQTLGLNPQDQYTLRETAIPYESIKWKTKEKQE